MHIVLAIGRVLFVLVFIIHGIGKLTDVSGTAAAIAGKVAVPAALADVTAQLQSATGMSSDQLLVAAGGVIELVGGLLLAFGIGTRWVALVLLVYTLLVTYYLHDFWNMTGAERLTNIIQAEKSLIVVGGLLILFAVGNWRAVWRRSDVAP